MVPSTFIGSYGGHGFNLNGTVQEVMAQLEEKHPGVHLEKREMMSLHVRDKVRFHYSSSHNSTSHSQIMPPLCIPITGWNWQNTGMEYINAGIYYLTNLNGRLGMPPKSCSRISCSYNSAIYLCNDNDYHIEPASAYIASYAKDLVDLCTTGSFDKFPKYRYTGGQEFGNDGYNVIVKHDNC
jgi:hypothetical protein